MGISEKIWEDTASAFHLVREASFLKFPFHLLNSSKFKEGIITGHCYIIQADD